MCLGSSGLFVLFWIWVGVGLDEFALFVVSGFLEDFVILEESLHCIGWLLKLVLSVLEM